MASSGQTSSTQWMLSSKAAVMNHMASHKRSWVPAPPLPDVPASIRVFVRARPLLKPDLDAGMYSILEVQEPRTVHITSGSARALAGRIATKSYDADGAFGPSALNDDVYRGIGVDRAIEQALEKGGFDWNALMYGQTGTGKTFTATAIEERLTETLFEMRPADNPPAIKLAIFELRASSVYDLLSDPPLQPVKVLGTEGENSLKGLTRHDVDSVAQMRELLEKAKELRATRSTVKNDTSSRSHCVVSIHVLHPGPGEVTKRTSTLHIIDLAGFERSSYSQHNDAIAQKESIETNKSLAVLKECIRARLDPDVIHVPWRSSRLTMVLRRAFEQGSKSRSSEMVVLACVSPSAVDVEDSGSTLKWVMPFQLAAAGQMGGAPAVGNAPLWREDWTDWTHEESVDYLKRFMPKLAPICSRFLPPGATIRNLLNLSLIELSALCSKPAPNESESPPPTAAQIKDARVWVGTYFQKLRDLKEAKSNPGGGGKGKKTEVRKVGGTAARQKEKALRVLDGREVGIGETGRVTRIDPMGGVVGRMEALEPGNRDARV